MEAFKFKKSIYEIDKGVMEEFNQRFEKIEKDEFLTNTNYGAKVKPVTLTGYKEYETGTHRWQRIDEYDTTMDKYMGDEYDAKLGLYQEFIQWLTDNHKNKTILGRVHCPYTNEVIREVHFPTMYTMSKRSYQLGDFLGNRDTYKIKVKELFRINLKNNPLNHMSKKALNLFFNYWSYDVRGKVTLKDAKDKNLLEVTSLSGTLYYGYGDETWSNQMYYANKGFFVKMKKERVYVPSPSYKGLMEDLEMLSKGGIPTVNKEKLPTNDERVKNAIEFGVLDSSLMPREETGKAEVVSRIKQIIDSITSEEDVVNAYDLIKGTMLGDS